MNVLAFFERRGWIILLVISAIFLLFGVGDFIIGMDADPAIGEGISGQDWDELKATQPDLARLINYQVRAGGTHILVLSLLSIAIILKPYRRGEQWAWVVLWVFPLWNVLIFSAIYFTDRPAGSPTPPPMQSAPIFFTALVLTLLLSYRMFFPRSQVGTLQAEPTASNAWSGDS